MNITIPNRILRELNVIKTILNSQLLTYDPEDAFPYLLNEVGQSGIDGRYITNMHIFSNAELFSLQLYEDEFTQRYEKTSSHTLIQNQLTEIKCTALEIVDFYNTHLTKKGKIVCEFIERKNALRSPKHFEENEKLNQMHFAVVIVSDYYIDKIYLGCTIDQARSSHNKTFSYNYISDNYELASICQRIVDFIDKFNFAKDSTINDTAQKFNLASIFNEESNAFGTCLALFEDQEITIGGQPNRAILKKGRIGILTGLITAIAHTPYMLKVDSLRHNKGELLKYFNSYLGTNYKSFSIRNNDFEPAKEDAASFIKRHFKK